MNILNRFFLFGPLINLIITLINTLVAKDAGRRERQRRPSIDCERNYAPAARSNRLPRDFHIKRSHMSLYVLIFSLRFLLFSFIFFLSPDTGLLQLIVIIGKFIEAL